MYYNRIIILDSNGLRLPAYTKDSLYLYRHLYIPFVLSICCTAFKSRGLVFGKLRVTLQY